MTVLLGGGGPRDDGARYRFWSPRRRIHRRRSCFAQTASAGRPPEPRASIHASHRPQPARRPTSPASAPQTVSATGHPRQSDSPTRATVPLPNGRTHGAQQAGQTQHGLVRKRRYKILAWKRARGWNAGYSAPARNAPASHISPAGGELRTKSTATSWARTKYELAAEPARRIESRAAPNQGHRIQWLEKLKHAALPSTINKHCRVAIGWCRWRGWPRFAADRSDRGARAISSTTNPHSPGGCVSFASTPWSDGFVRPLSGGSGTSRFTHPHSPASASDKLGMRRICALVASIFSTAEGTP